MSRCRLYLAGRDYVTTKGGIVSVHPKHLLFHLYLSLCVDFPMALPDFPTRGRIEDHSLAGAVKNMTRILYLILCLGFVAACQSDGGDVLVKPPEDTSDPETGDGDDETPIDSDGRTPELPPGTTTPTPDSSIVRREALDEEDGGGYATNIEYRNDQGQDEFVVDNLAFDGNNVYTRGDPVTGVAQLGSYAVYEGAEQTTDPVTGSSLNTFTYRAVYGRSATGETEFAIVRSGSYVDYGFGGFVYQRNGVDNNGDSVGLVLPNEGDAHL